MKLLLKAFCFFSGILLLWSGCTSDAPGPNQDETKLTFKTVWPGSQVSRFTIRIGETEMQTDKTVVEFDKHLDPGTHHYNIYNNASGFVFDNLTAVVETENGYLVSPSLLSAVSGDVEIVEGEDNREEVTVPLMVRPLYILLNFADDKSEAVVSVEGRLTGIASQIDLETGIISQPSEINPIFVRTGADFASEYVLLGTVGTGQIITLDIGLEDETFRLTTDLSTAFEDFNSDKNKARQIELSISNIGLDGVTLEIVAWEDVDIREKGEGIKPGDEQLSIDWDYMTDNITALTITDENGAVHSSMVENGKTTGLYERPIDIARLDLATSDGKNHNATLRIESYDNSTGMLVVSPDFYFIGTVADLSMITDDMAGMYKLKADLDFQNSPIHPLGYMDGEDYVPFSGILDGNGYSLRNFTLNPVMDRPIGFIGMNTGSIRNLSISGSINEPDCENVSALCGTNDGIIENCITKVVTNGQNAAAITVRNEGSIIGCTNHGTVSASEAAAGIALYNQGRIENCINNGKIVSDTYRASGIAVVNSSQISECINNGEVSAASYAGGIASVNEGGSRIEKSVNSGTAKIYGGTYSGGICGQNPANAFVTASSNQAEITGKGRTGGITASNFGSVTASKNTGDVTTEGEFSGGIAGENKGFILACYNNGNILGGNYTGGISGNNNNELKPSTIAAVYNTGNVTGNNYAGQLVGYNYYYGNVLRSYYTSGSPIGYDLGYFGTVETYMFHYDPDAPENTHWPEEDTANYWGIATSENTPENNYFWKSFGDPSQTIYPTLWWE